MLYFSSFISLQLSYSFFMFFLCSQPCLFSRVHLMNLKRHNFVSSTTLCKFNFKVHHSHLQSGVRRDFTLVGNFHYYEEHNVNLATIQTEPYAHTESHTHTEHHAHIEPRIHTVCQTNQVLSSTFRLQTPATNFLVHLTSICLRLLTY